jgi:hypothetical protein
MDKSLATLTQCGVPARCIVTLVFAYRAPAPRRPRVSRMAEGVVIAKIV